MESVAQRQISISTYNEVYLKNKLQLHLHKGWILYVLGSLEESRGWLSTSETDLAKGPDNKLQKH